MKDEKICVFCAASERCDKIYLEEAAKLGKALARGDRTIIYGGGSVGLMGALANAALDEGGKVIGVITEFLRHLELAHKDILEMKVVKGLHPREEIMLRESDCQIALPGGIGTFSELLQAITWKRLWQINSKIIIVNVNDYFNHLLDALNKSIEERFLKEEFANLWTVVSSAEEAVDLLE